MSTIQDSLSSSQRPSRDGAIDTRPALRHVTPTFATDTLRRNNAEPSQIAYDATIDGTNAQVLMKNMGGPVHQHLRNIKPINDAELRHQVARLCEHAANVKDERDMARLGHQAQDLLDQVNATPVGVLSEAARQSAARAVVPLAQAGEFNDLLAQAKGMLGATSTATRRQGVEFMTTHGGSIHHQMRALELPQAAYASLEKLYAETCALAAGLFWMLQDSKHQADQDEKVKAEQVAWTVWVKQMTNRLLQGRSEELKSTQRLNESRQNNV
jgi:hypothetical protein